MTNYALGLHTTSPELALGLATYEQNASDDISDLNDAQIRCQTWLLGRDLSIYLHDYLQTFVEPIPWQSLSWLAVARGPGSFTGTRMGVVTARTLAQQLQIPLFAVSTLAAAAWHVCQQAPRSDKLETLIVVALPAQQGQLYGAIYQLDSVQPGLIAKTPDQVFSCEAWQDWVNQAKQQHPGNFLSIGADTPTPFPEARALCQALLQLAYQEWQQGKRPHWSLALPFYGQSPV
jgi:tRNA threonylcarbamoyl adenosine modification protein YeaZ